MRSMLKIFSICCSSQPPPSTTEKHWKPRGGFCCECEEPYLMTRRGAVMNYDDTLEEKTDGECHGNFHENDCYLRFHSLKYDPRGKFVYECQEPYEADLKESKMYDDTLEEQAKEEWYRIIVEPPRGGFCCECEEPYLMTRRGAVMNYDDTLEEKTDGECHGNVHENDCYLRFHSLKYDPRGKFVYECQEPYEADLKESKMYDDTLEEQAEGEWYRIIVEPPRGGFCCECEEPYLMGRRGAVMNYNDTLEEKTEGECHGNVNEHLECEEPYLTGRRGAGMNYDDTLEEEAEGECYGNVNEHLRGGFCSESEKPYVTRRRGARTYYHDDSLEEKPEGNRHRNIHNHEERNRFINECEERFVAGLRGPRMYGGTLEEKIKEKWPLNPYKIWQKFHSLEYEPRSGFIYECEEPNVMNPRGPRMYHHVNNLEEQNEGERYQNICKHELRREFIYDCEEPFVTGLREPRMYHHLDTLKERNEEEWHRNVHKLEPRSRFICDCDEPYIMGLRGTRMYHHDDILEEQNDGAHHKEVRDWVRYHRKNLSDQVTSQQRKQSTYFKTNQNWDCLCSFFARCVVESNFF